jgi:hypothetical protein
MPEATAPIRAADGHRPSAFHVTGPRDKLQAVPPAAIVAAGPLPTRSAVPP